MALHPITVSPIGLGAIAYLRPMPVREYEHLFKYLSGALLSHSGTHKVRCR